MVPSPTPTLRSRFTLIVVLAIVAADQVTKALVVASLPLHGSVTIVPGLLNLTHVHNTGAAFGVLNAVDFPYKAVVLTAAALAALLAIGFYAERFGAETRLGRAGMALVVAGAIGNLIDRARQGYVVDFVDAHFRGWHFWAFNVADAAITIGAACVILDALLPRRTHVPEAV
jgi:signal peptidase II